jgi:hypothetical protein
MENVWIGYTLYPFHKESQLFRYKKQAVCKRRLDQVRVKKQSSTFPAVNQLAVSGCELCGILSSSCMIIKAFVFVENDVFLLLLVAGEGFRLCA